MLGRSRINRIVRTASHGVNPFSASARVFSIGSKAHYTCCTYVLGLDCIWHCCHFSWGLSGPSPTILAWKVVILLETTLYLYLPIILCFLIGKYGRLLLVQHNEKRLRSDPTGLYRREGLVRVKRKSDVFEAPFIEFDAYRMHTPSGRGGRYYNLMLQHRYSSNQLWMKGLVTDAMNPKDINAYWSMIQQFMDVSGPLPDVPIFEPFRHRDPVTHAADRKSGRDAFFWRNMTNDQWRAEHEDDCQQRMQDADFNKHHCQDCILDARIQGRGLPLPGNPRGTRLA